MGAAQAKPTNTRSNTQRNTSAKIKNDLVIIAELDKSLDELGERFRNTTFHKTLKHHSKLFENKDNITNLLVFGKNPIISNLQAAFIIQSLWYDWLADYDPQNTTAKANVERIKKNAQKQNPGFYFMKQSLARDIYVRVLQNQDAFLKRLKDIIANSSPQTTIGGRVRSVRKQKGRSVANRSGTSC